MGDSSEASKSVVNFSSGDFFLDLMIPRLGSVVNNHSEQSIYRLEPGMNTITTKGDRVDERWSHFEAVKNHPIFRRFSSVSREPLK